MRRIQFPEDDIIQLNKERLQHNHPIVRRRMTALYLKAKGYRHKDICKELGITHVCLYEYLDLYIKDGLNGLKHLGYRGKRNLLDENRDLIMSQFKTAKRARGLHWRPCVSIDQPSFAAYNHFLSPVTYLII